MFMDASPYIVAGMTCEPQRHELTRQRTYIRGGGCKFRRGLVQLRRCSLQETGITTSSRPIHTVLRSTRQVGNTTAKITCRLCIRDSWETLSRCHICLQLCTVSIHAHNILVRAISTYARHITYKCLNNVPICPIPRYHLLPRGWR